ncbi:MAG TPA: DUF4328 domain-containing protein [Myxococcota bacterium]
MARETTPSPDLGPAAASQLPLFISPRALTLGVAAGLIVSALVAWLSVGVHLAQVIQLRSQLSGAAVDAEHGHRIWLTLRIAQGVQATVLGVTALFFFAWLYRLRVNARALGVRKFAYARHWSVLGFLIPALNFVRPYQVMAEVWRASDPSVLDPFDWTHLEPPRILTLWWASVVIAATLELAAFGLGQTAGVDAFKSLVANAVAVVADTATGASASLAYFVVTRLTATQAAKRERLLGHAEDA